MSDTINATPVSQEVAQTHAMPATQAGNQPAAVPMNAAGSGAVMQMIMRASDPSAPIDLDRMERLMSMHDKMAAKEAETAFDAAKSAARSEVGAIIKNQQNSHTSSNYADLDQILSQLVPATSKHGLNVTFRPWDAGQGWQGLSIIVSGHGHKEESQLKMPLDDAGSGGKKNKNGAQAVVSTLTYLQRSLVRLAFNLSTGKDDDGNYGQEAEIMPEAMVNHITGLLIDTGTRLQAFLGAYQVEAIPHLSPDQADEAIAALEKKANRKGGEA